MWTLSPPWVLRLVKVNVVSASDRRMERTDSVCRFQSAAHLCHGTASLQCVFPSICVLHAYVEYVSDIKCQFRLKGFVYTQSVHTITQPCILICKKGIILCIWIMLSSKISITTFHHVQFFHKIRVMIFQIMYLSALMHYQNNAQSSAKGFGFNDKTSIQNV